MTTRHTIAEDMGHDDCSVCDEARAQIQTINTEMLEALRQVRAFADRNGIHVPVAVDTAIAKAEGRTPVSTMPPEPATRPTEITLQLGMFAKQYTLYRTNAPQRYDYSYVLTLLEDDGTRWILIPPESADYQIGRYHSGLYWTVPSADFDVEDIVERLWKAITDTFTDPGAE